MSSNDIAILHVGICCSDLDRSLAFYTEALGFSHERDIGEIGAPFDVLIDIPGAKFYAHQLKSGNTMIELVGYLNHEVSGSSKPRPMNQIGFTHMTLTVGDLAATTAKIKSLGGQVLENTHTDSDFGSIVFCTDPDGVRIELMQLSS